MTQGTSHDLINKHANNLYSATNRSQQHANSECCISQIHHLTWN